MLNRVFEDGILPQWIRKPHRRFGTSFRILNLVVALRIVTIILSRGDIFVLGEAYAFGVIMELRHEGACRTRSPLHGAWISRFPRAAQFRTENLRSH